jgi:hypothetical protein
MPFVSFNPLIFFAVCFMQGELRRSMVKRINYLVLNHVDFKYSFYVSMLSLLAMEDWFMLKSIRNVVYIRVSANFLVM